MHVIVLDESDTKDQKVSGATLYKGREDEDPYKYLPYEEVDGRGLGVGVVEDLFEAQVWTNDSVKKKKDILELAGKNIFQTADQNIAAKNILTEIENGQIITTSPNGQITQQHTYIPPRLRSAHRRVAIKLVTLMMYMGGLGF